MNGDSPSTNKGVIFVVIAVLAFNASLGLSSLAYCMVFKIEPNQVLLTAIMNITAGLLGVIGGMLTKTSPTETTKAAIVTSLPTTTTAKVEVVNPPETPVQTEEVKS